MSYACIQLFMEKLNQLINCNDNRLINHSKITRERPQFQLLYDDLGYMIQTLFIDQHQDLHDLEKLKDLKQRFICAAEEAQYVVDIFLSVVHVGNIRHLHTYRYFKRSQSFDDDVSGSFKFKFKSAVSLFLSCCHIRNNEHYLTHADFKRSLNLDEVRRSFKSVEVEFMSMKMVSPERKLIQSTTAPISISRNSQGSKKLLDEIVVGLDHDVELVRDKLVADRPTKVDVVSIIGMGGIGKTTLATKVFNDHFILHHFYVRVWVTVSQTYDKRAVLIQILESIRAQLGLEKASDSRLREMVHKSLMGRRYLIVLDDIWDIEAWDNLKLLFPHDNIGSRIMITSRLNEVAKHANPNGLIHHLGYLNKDKGWELLCRKVFHGNECMPGMVN